MGPVYQPPVEEEHPIHVKIAFQHPHRTTTMMNMEILPTKPVSQLRNDLYEKFRVRPENQKWLYNGHTLQPTDTLNSIGVNAGSTIEVKEIAAGNVSQEGAAAVPGATAQPVVEASSSQSSSDDAALDSSISGRGSSEAANVTTTTPGPVNQPPVQEEHPILVKIAFHHPHRTTTFVDMEFLSTKPFSELRNDLYEKFRVRPENQTWLYNGHELQPTDTLSSIGVNEGSTIEVKEEAA